MNKIIWAVAVLAAFGCANKAAAPTAVEETKKEAKQEAPAFDLKALAARELPEGSKQSFALGEAKAEVEAAAAPTLNVEEKFISLGIPLAGASELTCFLYKEAIDSGATLLNVIKMAERKVEVQQVRPTAIVPVGQIPAIYLMLDYLVKGEQGMLAGQMKAMVFPSEVAPMMCIHDEVGFRQSFQRITLGLAKSLTQAAAATKSAQRYAELIVLKLGEVPVGFERETHVDGKNDTVVVTHLSSMFLPRSAKQLVVEDGVQTVVSDKAGRLLKLEHVKAANGEIEEQISVSREKNGEYSYKGKHSGKEVAGKFKAKGKDGVASGRAVAKAMKEQLLAGKQAEVKLEEYQPGINPGGTVETSYKLADKATRAVTATLNELTLSEVLDEQGYTQRMEMPLGPASLVGERVFSQGTP